MKSQKIIARTFGIFFLLAFLSYGTGTVLTTAITDGADAMNLITANKNQLIFGAILMALVHTIVNIGLPVLMMPLLKPFNKIVAYGYLSACITATIIVIIGAIFLLLHIPLFTENVALEAPSKELISQILSKGNFYAYQIGMAIWAIGGLLFSYLLFISKLVPRIFSVWGFVGYSIFMIGTIAELFGHRIGDVMALPGGLFEVTLSIFLIIKGFKVTIPFKD